MYLFVTVSLRFSVMYCRILDQKLLPRHGELYKAGLCQVLESCTASSGPNTGSNPGGERILKKLVAQINFTCKSTYNHLCTLIYVFHVLFLLTFTIVKIT